MTNNQCYSYSIIAIDNIIKNGHDITSDNFYDHLYYLWDIYSEREIEQVARNRKLHENLIKDN